MLRRIFYSLTTLAAILVAYESYLLLAVPHMEPPPVERKRGGQVAMDEPGSPLQSVNKYQLLLRNYFPEGHWSLVNPPMVFQIGPALLVLDPKYERYTKDEGTEDASDVIDIRQFALLIYQTPHREGLEPPRDAIVLEAPQGAHLEFKNFRPERGEVGEIRSGKFPGQITIRSDMNAPGPEDDLFVETSDLDMNTRLMVTSAPVRFRLGQSMGGGRELEIRFLADEQAPTNKANLNISGIDSLEIRRDVRLRLQMDATHMLPGEAASPRDGMGDKNQKPPVEVSCTGPFHFDFVRYVASFDRDVELRQIQPDGPSDQLTCQQLDLRFAAKELPAGAQQTVIVDPARRQQRDLGRLEPVAIVAQGHPVVMISPGRGAEARGDRIQIGLRDQRLLIDGGRDVMITYAQNVLRAPAIEYRQPTDKKATKIGRFRAAGPGSLNYVPDLTKPNQVFQATWQTSVELGRSNGQPVLTLEGRPSLGMANLGGMTADRVRVLVRELQGDATGGLGMLLAGTASQRSKIQVVPDRLEATGHVEIDSPELTGKTEELLATFHVQPEPAADAADAAATAAGDGAAASSGSLADQFGPRTSGQPSKTYHIDTDRLQVDVNMLGQRAQPANLTCDGHVLLREIPQRQAEQPLEIRGAQLAIAGLDTGNAHITIRGAALGENPTSQFAQFAARGVTFLANVVEMDQRENRLWSDGPGKATMMLTRDFQGNPSATPFPAEIRWQGGLNFDGAQVVFDREITVFGADDSLRCDRLIGKLNAPIQFGKRFDEGTVDLAEMECQGQVAMDHVSRDVTGVTSHERMELARLAINQKTGVIGGDGPGMIRSTHFANGQELLVNDQGPKKPDTRLHFLRVDFQKRLAGNIYTKELSFYERVKSIYGPVDSWEQELDPNRRDSLPPEGAMLACDELRVNEDPIAARAAASPYSVGGRRMGPIQLQARGNVHIEGQSPTQGVFDALCDRASYEQSKDMFVLEGNDVAPAKLWQKKQPGVDPIPFEARKIRFVRSTGVLNGAIDGFKYLEFTPQSLPSSITPSLQDAQLPGPQRR